MTRKPISYLTGKVLKSWYEDLKKNEKEGGCCSINFGDTDTWNYCICMGWTDGYDPNEEFKSRWRLAVGPKRQKRNNVMQCDFDLDFDYPYNKDTGDCDVRDYVFEKKPTTMKEWNQIAAWTRRDARGMWRDWKDYHDEGGWLVKGKRK